MGWLTDIGVSRLFGQQGTTGGGAAPARLRGGGWEPSTGHGRPFTVAGRPLASPPPAGPAHLVVTFPDNG